jgi:hypothetical protein
MEDHPVPTLLYHYTDARGFLGIVESRAIWATHIQYLNDTQEYRYAVDLAMRIILERAPMAADSREQVLLTRLGTDLNAGGRVYVCVASFSEVDDALSQWRGYCPNGAGYSIGFVARDLIRVAGRQGFSLAQCLYDDVSQTQAIAQVLEEVRWSVWWTRPSSNRAMTTPIGGPYRRG